MKEHRELQTLIDQLNVHTREQDEAIKALQKTNEYLVAQLKKAMLAEREDIAKMFEAKIWAYESREIAAAIRARGEK